MCTGSRMGIPPLLTLIYTSTGNIDPKNKFQMGSIVEKRKSLLSVFDPLTEAFPSTSQVSQVL